VLSMKEAAALNADLLGETRQVLKEVWPSLYDAR